MKHFILLLIIFSSYFCQAQKGHKKHYPLPGYENGIAITPDMAAIYRPGDTIVLGAAFKWGVVSFDGLHGTAKDSIVIINEGGQTYCTTTHLYNSTYIHWTGTGTPGVEYGFKVENDPLSVMNGLGVSFEAKSKGVHYNNIEIHNVAFGVYAHEDPDCDPATQMGAWVQDSLVINHLKIVGVLYEGMYIGNTAPDNGPNSYDPRPLTCNGVVTYPKAYRNGYTHVYDCYIDSTGRGAIQMAGNSSGPVEIDHNIVKHSGLGGATSWGEGISIGAYTHGRIHHNTVINTLSHGIASLGGSGTNNLVIIDSNIVDSSGYLYSHNNTKDDIVFTPTTPFFAPGVLDDVSYVNGIAISTVYPSNGDSTRFIIKNNKIGLHKNSYDIRIEDGGRLLHKTGNIICNSGTYYADMPSNVSIATSCPWPRPRPRLQRVGKRFR